jgi:hypothetical protein
LWPNQSASFFLLYFLALLSLAVLGSAFGRMEQTQMGYRITLLGAGIIVTLAQVIATYLSKRQILVIRPSINFLTLLAVILKDDPHCLVLGIRNNLVINLILCVFRDS